MNQIYYERNLPHWHPPGATFFLTYRLAGSIPMSVLKAMQKDSETELKTARRDFKGEAFRTKLREIQARWFGRYDQWLHDSPNGPYWLREPDIANLVVESLHECAEKYFHLYAYAIMPNHVHVLLKHHEHARSLCDILQSHKGFTGSAANKLLGRKGQFWHRETYDHVVRNQTSFNRITRYILNNPVKAKLVGQWETWPFCYVDPGLVL